LWTRRLAGQLIALYIRLVRTTSKQVRLPDDMYERADKAQPAIYVSWHANVFAVPLFWRKGMFEVVGLASPHPDGQIAAACINALGVRMIMGTGATEKATHGTGGMAAFRALSRELAAGNSVFLTAEVPPTPGRIVSKGVIALARKSGRPIFAMAAATSRRTIVERLWDKMQINHPFSRLALVVSDAIMVDSSVTDAQAQAQLKSVLDDAYAQAMILADRKS
jgi:lysophospholipid acyltransferase (LPLAT)-like uncharacterized protein